MDDELKGKWVDALLSDEYEQITEVLRNDEGFCALGVLADVMGCEWQRREYIKDSPIHVAIFDYGGYGTSVPASVLDPDMQTTIATANDSGKSFREIALLIKEME